MAGFFNDLNNAFVDRAVLGTTTASSTSQVAVGLMDSQNASITSALLVNPIFSNSSGTFYAEQINPQFNPGAGVTYSQASGLSIAPTIAGSGTVTYAYGLSISGPVVSANTLTNSYPLYVTSPTGALSNYTAILGNSATMTRVGIATSQPAYTLDINAAASSARFYASGMTEDNQLIQLAEGYTQGGFGGGSVGTNKMMSDNSTTCFDLTTVNANSTGFVGGVFDGRYIYYAPCLGAASWITQYDTTLSFGSASSYTTFDTSQLTTNSVNFEGAVFDGRYVYFVPHSSGQVTRYDTTAPFFLASSYTTFNTTILSLNIQGYTGGLFDGRYVYFAPTSLTPIITQYDTTFSFTAVSSYTIFDPTQLSGPVESAGGAYDGRYIYFAPNRDSLIIRYDTSLPFVNSSSYTTYNVANLAPNEQYISAIFDGRFIYFVPNLAGFVLRYDTTLSFVADSSYATFSLLELGLINYVVAGGIFDERYVYFAPTDFSQIVRYDTTLSFTIGSFSLYDTSSVNANSSGFSGAIFDGRYVYFVPFIGPTGLVTRIDAYPGSQATAIAASQAPNGFAIGTYAGTIPPSGGLIVSGNVGINTASPQFTVDVNGTVNVSTLTVAIQGIVGSTANNQKINIAEGYNQGGFGGGSVGTNKTISANTVLSVNMAAINSSIFYGAAFDGRYIYYTPYGSSLALRYDTLRSFTTASGYLNFNVTSILDPSFFGFSGCVYDGRYVYFVPYLNQSFAGYGTVLRYDTTLSFEPSSSYSTFNLQTVSSGCAGFYGGVYDGRYIYFVPNISASGNPNGIVTQYDTMFSFQSVSSYTTFDATRIDPGGSGFQNGVYDGRYVYFVPYGVQNVGLSNTVVRYDTSLPFVGPSSWTAFNTAILIPPGGFSSAVFDGRFVYFFHPTEIFGKNIVRYDTNQPFTVITSYTVFDYSNLHTRFGFSAAVYDGRYLYFIPALQGNMLIYDTTLSFNAAASYYVFNFTYLSPDSQYISFQCGIFDGRYVYLAQNNADSIAVRFDAYPGPQATAIAASQAPNGFEIGSYAGSAPPTGGLIVSGNVGIGTSNPQYTVDVVGSVNAISSNVQVSGYLGSTANNQEINIAEGYNQGGFGGGLAGTNKTMSANSTTAFDMTQVNVDCHGFSGGVFDGRYIYFVPDFDFAKSQYQGTITRYDTTLPFSNVGSYATFNASQLDSRCVGFQGGGVYDGRYVYFVPLPNAVLTRYDTTLSFILATSYSTYNMLVFNSSSIGYRGAVFDGRYVYLVPYSINSSGFITLYDTMLPFTSALSYTTFNAQLVNNSCHDFFGGVYDGRYVYFVPFNNSTSGIVLRYDTSLSFVSGTSYTTFDMANLVNSNCKGFAGGIFDGRYIYFVPYNAGASGVITRYDTTSSFLTSSSYAIFDTAQVDSNSKAFFGGVYDGRYVYLASTLVGQIARYDTTLSFFNASSYTLFYVSIVNAQVLTYWGALFDGRYVYCIPWVNGIVSRVDAYPGPEATAIAANQAPNGFAIGSYAGTNTVPTGGMIVSGNVGINTSSPQYTVDVNGTINAANILVGGILGYLGSTANNQLINIAEGYNQGGFGSGLVGTNKTMSANSTTTFDMTQVNANCIGFTGSAFDGRYIYFVPNNSPLGYSGTVARYDTTLPFNSTGSYTTFDLAQLSSMCRGFQGGGVYDGRYVYFVPYIVNSNVSYTIARYDTTGSFFSRSSYTIYDLSLFNVSATEFFGAIFDGRYIYFIGNGFNNITRYDTIQPFNSAASYAISDTPPNLISPWGGTFDGRYVYVPSVPYTTGFSDFLQYDTSLPFLSSSYIYFKLSNIDRNILGYRGAVFDGRYVYFVPYGVSFNGSNGINGTVVRYDTQGSFASLGSFTTFDLVNLVNSQSAGFNSAVFDGRYVYFMPSQYAQLTRYDTTQSFFSASSYTTIQLSTSGFWGGMFDGRYVYLVPNSNGQATRLDAYPGSEATAIAASQAPNGFAIGSYAGTSAVPSGGMIVSGNVGINTASPQYTVDVNGTVKATLVNTNSPQQGFLGSTANNQQLNIAEGYNQGGFGSGLVGTNKTMSANSTTIFDMTQLSSNCMGFSGAVFDGRYIYFVPYFGASPYSGTIARYDTTAAFNLAASYATFDLAQINTSARGFQGGVYDGQYIYFLPNFGAVPYSNTIARYDTTLSFYSVSSYTLYNLGAFNSFAGDCFGAIFDGRYIYLVSATPALTKYDTMLPLNATSSFQIISLSSGFNNQMVNPWGGAFCGRYIYVPSSSNSYLFQYDTSLPFGVQTSSTTFNLALIDGNIIGYRGATFDGRYIYFVPYGHGNNGSNALNGTVVRYDCQSSFVLASSFTTFDLVRQVHSSCRAFSGAVFDGRYIYFIPLDTAVMARYDTTQSFFAASSYTAMTLVAGCWGGVFDGRYIYTAPYFSGQVTRIDAYPGSQVTALSASQAPNGFAVGSYAGTSLVPTGGLIVSSSVGIGTSSPQYAVDVSGNVNANLTYVYTPTYYQGSTVDNQLINIAEGSNQGGFGGGSVGTNKTMSLNSATCFDSLTVNSNNTGFGCGAFDGRYVYMAAGNFSGTLSQILRYDTSQPFYAAGSYTTFDTRSVDVHSFRHSVALYDGRYVYLADFTWDGRLLQYDTTRSFTTASSYVSFDTAAILAAPQAYQSGVFDGRFVYFLPYNVTPGPLASIIVRFDTMLLFSSSSSYATFDTKTANANSVGFQSGTFDGRYVYILPISGGLITRYDTSLSFVLSGSYTTYDVTRVNQNSSGFYGAVFDGRYVYFVPNGASCLLTRYDTQQNLINSASYTTFDLAGQVNSNCIGFQGGTFDGRYVYFVPYNGTNSGLVARYDTTLSFLSSASYAILDLTGLNSNSRCFLGAVFDGRYVYLVPFQGISQGVVTRIDSYPGPEATALAASQAPNGFAVGSYAGAVTPSGGLIVSGNVGINTSNPQFAVDVNGSVNSAGGLNVYSPIYYLGSTANNQAINIAEGYNQGGFSSGLIGTSKLMSANSITCFNTQTINVNSRGFHGGVFDGRYVYLIPYESAAGPSGTITRYDTTLSFFSADSYTTFDMLQLNTSSKRFAGGVFDGRYVYLVPYANPATFGQITRYDTTSSFTAAASYTTFDTNNLNTKSKGFWGGVFDGRYVYLVPFTFGQITRYDTTLSFLLATSYTTFDTQTVNANSYNFAGGVFDGRYVYLVPNASLAPGQITRYDTTLSFLSAASYAIFDTAGVNTGSKGFIGGVFDGRYVYLVPYNNGSSFGQITRYDTTLSFLLATSYTTFNTTALNANSKGFKCGVFDGRYIYLLPYDNSQITKYDTTQSFLLATSYTTFNLNTVNANSNGFYGGVFDGRYVYLVPFFNGSYFGRITRIDTYSGPQATAMAVSQAPNGLSVGAYAGTSAQGNLILSGKLGIGTSSPQYLLDVNGTISATTLKRSVLGLLGSTADNQIINVAEGYNQGGFGSSLVGTNKMMSANSTTCFDLTGFPSTTGFVGSAFDGRYIYLIPYNTIKFFTRYDTTLPFSLSSSYTTFDLRILDTSSATFNGGIYDGRYVYFPNIQTNGNITRYDTTLSFTAATSYTVMIALKINANCNTMAGGMFDGRYVYFVSAANGYVTQYDTLQSFTSVGSYTTFNTTTINSINGGFFGGTFDGRYVYFTPEWTQSGFTRYDTSLPFILPTSFTTFKTGGGDRCAVFDGRYVYLLPHFNGSNYGVVTRYDTTQSFTATSSYTTFNLTFVNTNAVRFVGGAFDGRYIYFCPSVNGYIPRYDTTLSFNSVNSYTVLNTTNFNSKSANFAGVTFDGRYVYFFPFALGSTTVITRIDAYPGPQATVIAAYQAPNGFVVGSYAGVNAAPLGGLIASGQVGVASANPQYALDIAGTLNATSLNSLTNPANQYATGGTTRNQLITLAQGYNQGGFGGGFVGTNKTMSFYSVTCFDTQTLNASSRGFNGAVFDGRYIYFVPLTHQLAVYFGQITRYDTTLPFSSAVSYTTYDTIQVDTNSQGFAGAVFDGRYVYFVPGILTTITRYDSTYPFNLAISYTTYNVSGFSADSFWGAVFDGQYVYFVPKTNNHFVRYDSTLSFNSASSYAAFDLSFVNANSSNFKGAVFDGMYVYLIPNTYSVITRFDSSLAFAAISSYTTFDSTSAQSNAYGFWSGVFDGRYVYFVPNTYTQLTRYDTTLSFNLSGSYTTFDLLQVNNPNGYGFSGAVFDGRYIYLVPTAATSDFGQVIRYDTTLSFFATGSYTVYDTTLVNANSKGFRGAVFDGRYVYLVPYSFFLTYSGRITRIDAYPGPQATAMAASQAPNGFAVGEYAGAGNLNGNLIISGNFGIGVATPTYSLQLGNDSAAKPNSNFWNIISDERIKQNIRDLSGSLSFIRQLRPRKFQYQPDYAQKIQADPRAFYYGFIADEVESVVDGCVEPSGMNFNENALEIQNLKSLNIHNILIHSIQAIKELTDRAEDLQRQLKDL